MFYRQIFHSTLAKAIQGGGWSVEVALQNSEIFLPRLKLTVKNYKKKMKKNMACYWIECISQYNFSDLKVIIIIFII